MTETTEQHALRAGRAFREFLRSTWQAIAEGGNPESVSAYLRKMKRDEPADEDAYMAWALAEPAIRIVADEVKACVSLQGYAESFVRITRNCEAVAEALTSASA